jgi:uncharacterized protein (DUF1501 family)
MAVAYATGYLPSASAAATYTIVAETPKFTPNGGVFVGAATVSISDGTKGAEIYYTTNGSKPTKASTHYTKAFTITKNETVTAVAFATGVNESAAAKVTFDIRAAAPKFSPAAGKYSKSVTVSISDVTKGAVIYYTTNGKTPETTSTRYTKPFVVSATKTIKAMALAPGGTESVTTSATYTIAKSPATKEE